MEHPIVNVSGGNGVIMSPAILSCRWNLARRQQTSDTVPKHSNLIFEIPDHVTFSLDNEIELCTAPNSHEESGCCADGDLQKCIFFGRVWEALEREGLAVVRTPKWVEHIKNEQSHENYSEVVDTALLQIVEALGCVPHMHSSVAGSVWDVRPVHDKVLSIDSNSSPKSSHHKNPRSKTAEAFDMHTDCSFESPPPR